LAHRRAPRDAVTRDRCGRARRARGRAAVTSEAVAARPVPSARGARWARSLAALRQHPHRSRGLVVHGVLRRLTGMTLEAAGCEVPVGSRCVVTNDRGQPTETEVLGFAGGSLLLLPMDEVDGLTRGARVVP